MGALCSRVSYAVKQDPRSPQEVAAQKDLDALLADINGAPDPRARLVELIAAGSVAAIHYDKAHVGNIRIVTAGGGEVIEDVSVPLPEAGKTLIIDETVPGGFKWVDAASVTGAMKTARRAYLPEKNCKLLGHVALPCVAVLTTGI